MDKKNFIILFLSMVLAAFLGSFFAFVLIHRSHNHFETSNYASQSATSESGEVFEQPEKIMKEQEKFFNKFNGEAEDFVKQTIPAPSFISVSNTGVKVRETEDAYKMVVDLKPFNKDEKNVNIKIRGNTVFVSANYKNKDNQKFASASFNQILTFPVKIDKRKVKKEQVGGLLMITIPKK